jgi:hypothetical protein
VHYRSSSVFSLGRWASQLPTGLACPVVLRNSVGIGLAFAYRTGTVYGGLFNTLRLATPTPSTAPTTPSLCSVWAVPRSLATTSGMISVPLGTEMFQFPRFPSAGLCVHPATPAQSCDEPAGFPIRTSPDIAPAHGSPRLFAVFHVLLRHLTPRHPPYALGSFLPRDAEKLCFHSPGSSPGAIRLVKCWPRDWLTAAGRLGLPRSVRSPSDASECLRAHRWGAKPGLGHRLTCDCSAATLALPAKQPGISPGCFSRHLGRAASRSVVVGLFSSGERSIQQVRVYPQRSRLKHAGGLSN